MDEIVLMVVTSGISVIATLVTVNLRLLIKHEQRITRIEERVEAIYRILNGGGGKREG